MYFWEKKWNNLIGITYYLCKACDIFLKNYAQYTFNIFYFTFLHFYRFYLFFLSYILLSAPFRTSPLVPLPWLLSSQIPLEALFLFS